MLSIAHIAWASCPRPDWGGDFVDSGCVIEQAMQLYIACHKILVRLHLQQSVYLAGLHAHALPDVCGHSLDYALAHLNSSLGGFIPPKLLLSVMRDLGNLDDLFQKDGRLLQHKLQVVLQLFGNFPPS